MSNQFNQKAIKLYREWSTCAALTEQEKAELLAIAGNEKEIEERFGEELTFGTGGMRGILGMGTNRMNRYIVRKSTKGYADYIRMCGTDACIRGIVIAHDNRYQSREFALESAGVLAANGIHVYLFPSLRPTPELSFSVRRLQAFGGIMITASHNPPEYNGYKLYDESGCQLVPGKIAPIIEKIQCVADLFAVEVLPQEQFAGWVTVLGDDLDRTYLEAVKKIQLHPELKKNQLRVVYSPQHGTGNIPVRTVLTELGYTVIPVEEQCSSDPAFSNTKNPNPEVEAAYELCYRCAEQSNADLIIATDPDCDRLGVAVLHGGTYVRMTGNQSAVVLLHYILTSRKQAGTLPENGIMFNTVVTSDLGDRICRDFGVSVEKTLTGFKYIGEKIFQHKQKGEKSFLFGYEESYGCLISDEVRDKDGVQASVLLCECAAYYAKSGKTLIDVLNELYTHYGYVADALESVTMSGSLGMKKIAEWMDGLRRNGWQTLGDSRIASVEDYMSDEFSVQGFPRSDVLRYVMEDGSWVAIRPSGTEPKCKFYYNIYGDSSEQAKINLSQIQASIHKIFFRK